jgi:hypothetical protein
LVFSQLCASLINVLSFLLQFWQRLIEQGIEVPFHKLLTLFGYDNDRALSELTTEDIDEMQQYIRDMPDEAEAQAQFGPMMLPRGLNNFQIFSGHRRVMMAAGQHCKKRLQVPDSMKVKGKRSQIGANSAPSSHPPGVDSSRMYFKLVNRWAQALVKLRRYYDFLSKAYYYAIERRQCF